MDKKFRLIPFVVLPNSEMLGGSFALRLFGQARRASLTENGVQPAEFPGAANDGVPGQWECSPIATFRLLTTGGPAQPDQSAPEAAKPWMAPIPMI
jgi:hypothetical protein